MNIQAKMTKYLRSGFSRPDGIDRKPYFYVAPLVLVYAALVAYPIVESFLMSFQTFPTVTKAEWVGLENYRFLLTSGDFWLALKNTAFFIIGMGIAPMIIALLLAIILDKGVKYNTTIRSLLFLPQVVPIVVSGVLFGWIFTEFGIPNSILLQFGIIDGRITWLSEPEYALPSVMTMAVWRQTGFYMVIFLAGLQSIPDEYYEAAKVQGKSSWQAFRHITLPLLKAPIITVSILGVMGAVKRFPEVWVMTGGGPGRSSEILATYFYRESFVSYNFGRGAAIGFIMFSIVLVMSIIIMKVGE